VALVARLLSDALLIFLLLLIFRLVMEWVFQLSRSYRPTGVMVIVLEITYSITDPPLRLLRRIIPPLRIGGVALDLAFLVLFILVNILRTVVADLGS
jgi:YggT family protein